MKPKKLLGPRAVRNRLAAARQKFTLERDAAIRAVETKAREALEAIQDQCAHGETEVYWSAGFVTRCTACGRKLEGKKL